MTIQHKINFPILYEPRYETPLFNVARARGIVKEYDSPSLITYHLIELGPLQDNYLTKVINQGLTVSEAEDLNHIVTLINNYKSKKNLLSDIPITDSFKLKIDKINSYYNKSLDYTCIILSSYKDYMFANIYTGLLIKLNNPNIDIIIGGVNINLSKNIRELIRQFNIFDYVIEGDIEEAIKRYLNGVLLPNDKVHIDSNRLPIPIYTDLEIRLFKSIIINTSRGCPNLCAFCTGNNPKFRTLSIDYAIDVFRYYNDKNRRRAKAYLNDNSVNHSKKRILDLTNSLIEINNQLKIFAEVTFEHLNEEIILNLFNANMTDLYIGIDGLHPKKQKLLNMTKIPDNYLDILRELYDTGCTFDLSYIYNTPGETREIFEYEFEKINQIVNMFPDIKRAYYCLRYYNHFAGSYMYLNPGEYGIEYEYWEPLDCDDEINEIVTRIPRYYYCDISKDEYDRRCNLMFKWENESKKGYYRGNWKPREDFLK
jgi:radical SAM superfamily enzyme YgiQ (UPF0313 family)